MTCQWCIMHEAKIKHLQRSKQFLIGTKAYKTDTIAYHETSESHKLAAKIQTAVDKPEDAPAAKAVQQLNEKHTSKLRVLFRNAQALAKYRKSLRDYTWLCQLDEAKGLTVGKTYRSDKACRTFTTYIAQAQKNDTKIGLDEVKFLTITSDGATDTGINEQEVVFIRYCLRGVVTTKFVGFEVPACPDAEGVYEAIKLALLNALGLTISDLKKKLVAFGCDGAAVMLGKKGGVSAKMKDEIQPKLVIVHCFAHRLELAYKDSVKANKVYDSVITLLMGLYYFYHRSPKQHQKLRRAFEFLNQVPAFPTRVGGTRWVGHMVLAMETFLKSYKAIYSQLEDTASQKNSKVDAAGKARGYLKLMKSYDVIGFIHILLDVLKPLRTFSVSLQSRDTTLAEVQEKIDVTVDVLEKYKDSSGPKAKHFLSQSENFQGVKLTRKLNDAQFDKRRATLSEKLVKSFQERFENTSTEVIAATHIANFKTWPSHDDKENISEFGNGEVETLAVHFQDILKGAGVDHDDAIAEWDMLKSNLYCRFKDAVHDLKWQKVWQWYGQSYFNILSITDLVRTLPASSAENERGFSQMKLVKTDRRSRMSNKTLNDLMTIQLEGPAVADFQPDPCIQAWLKGGKRKRRPGFKDNVPIKRARLEKRDKKDMGENAEMAVQIEGDEGGDSDQMAEVVQSEGEEERNKEETESEDDEVEVNEVVPKFDNDNDDGDQSDEGYEDNYESDFDNELTEEQVTQNLKNM